MNVLDLVIAVVLAVSCLYGLVRGFVRIAIGVAGLIVSLALALRFAARGTDWFGGAIGSPELARLAAFLAVLLAGLLATAAVAWVVWKLVRAANIDWVDRLAGAFVGLVGSAFLVCGLLVALTTFLPSGSPVLTRSTLVPFAIHVADMAAGVLPPEMERTYRERRRALDDLMREPAERRPARLDAAAGPDAAS